MSTPLSRHLTRERARSRLAGAALPMWAVVAATAFHLGLDPAGAAVTIVGLAIAGILSILYADDLA